MANRSYNLSNPSSGARLRERLGMGHFKLSRFARPALNFIYPNPLTTNGLQGGEKEGCRESTPTDLARDRGFGFGHTSLGKPTGQFLVSHVCPL